MRIASLLPCSPESTSRVPAHNVTAAPAEDGDESRRHSSATTCCPTWPVAPSTRIDVVVDGAAAAAMVLRACVRVQARSNG